MIEPRRRAVTRSFIGDLMTWEEPGQTLRGRYQGQLPSRYRSLGLIETAEGLKCFTRPAVLRRALTIITPGTEIEIQYAGKKLAPKSGHTYLDFDVFVIDDEDPR